MQEFNLDKKFITLMKACLAGFLLFLALGLALPFLPGEEKGNPNGDLYASILGVVLFGSLAIYTWLILKKLPYSDLGADEEGIWYKHLGKEQGLIAWESVYSVEERTYLQCLDLLDSGGKKLLRVEYQLAGFESLREMISARIAAAAIDLNRIKFKKGIFYHLFYFAGIIGSSYFGFYLNENNGPVLGYGMGILVVIFIYEYMVTATGLEIAIDSLVISYPAHKRIIHFPDITDIQISDTFHKGSRIPEVRIVSRKSKKPYLLKQLGVDASMLFARLRKAVQT